MNTSVSGRLQRSRIEAECLYSKLRTIFNDNDLLIAKLLEPFYKRSKYTIRRNLDKIAFKNFESNMRFIDAAQKILVEIEALPVNASALLLSRESASELRIKEILHLFLSHKIHVLAPQLLIDDTNDAKQFWNFVQADLMLCDFIIADDLLPAQRRQLEKINQNKLEIFEKNDVEFIKIQALQATLKKRDYVA